MRLSNVTPECSIQSYSQSDNPAETILNCLEVADDDSFAEVQINRNIWLEEMTEAEESYTEDDTELEIQHLREWAIEKQIFQSHLDDLLKILRSRLLPNLPKSSKTFLKVLNAKYNIVQMEDQNGTMGEFVYFRIEKELVKSVNPTFHAPKIIELQINVDAVPLTNSGVKQFTPILGKIFYEPDMYEVFPIAIFAGQAKPKSSRIFLEEFVDEINLLHKNGVLIDGVHFQVQLKCIICDTPARAFLKNILGHGGIYACERCTIQGVRFSNRTVYPTVNCEKRTDLSFRNKTQLAHHHSSDSSLLKIEPKLDMVSCFVLDFMHLVCIGVTKKLLKYWLKGERKHRLKKQVRTELNEWNH